MAGYLDNIYSYLCSLTIFRGLLSDPVIGTLRKFMEHSHDQQAADAYSEFVSALYESGSVNLSEYISQLVSCSDNPLVRLAAEGKTIPSAMKKAAEMDIAVLQKLCEMTSKNVKDELGYRFALADWEVSPVNLAANVSDQLKNIARRGYGIYAKYRAFYLDSDGRIRPVKNPDNVSLSDLIGYSREKKIIIDNTRALLDGKPAANILLVGDAGTGKSSTVKAVVNELWDEGLRILELKKDQLRLLHEVQGELSKSPLKFIIFIDDLSFKENDDNFSALKAMLEGSVSAKHQNVVFYATSNRRHLVKEKFSDREGDDVHRADTMQEIVSLSERFGIRVTFTKPDKATYLEIVRQLCEARSIEYLPQKLEEEAERFALNRSGRSARAAKQFVDYITSKQ